LYNHPERGYVIAAPGKDPVSVEQATARPTRVERLVAAVNGQIGREELVADLECAADAVAIVEACYQSSEKGHWVEVASLA
jgi:predicted dehydrogenase